MRNISNHEISIMRTVISYQVLNHEDCQQSWDFDHEDCHALSSLKSWGLSCFIKTWIMRTVSNHPLSRLKFSWGLIINNLAIQEFAHRRMIVSGFALQNCLTKGDLPSSEVQNWLSKMLPKLFFLHKTPKRSKLFLKIAFQWDEKDTQHD